MQGRFRLCKQTRSSRLGACMNNYIRAKQCNVITYFLENYNCNHLSMTQSQLNPISKRGPWHYHSRIVENLRCTGRRFRNALSQKQTLRHTRTQKRKGLQCDSPGIHRRRWSLSSTSPVNTKAVILTTFTFQCMGNSRYTNAIGCRYNVVSYDISYSTTVTDAEHKSDIKLTKDIPYLALMGELWGVYCDDLGDNWPRCISIKLWYVYWHTLVYFVISTHRFPMII